MTRKRFVVRPGDGETVGEIVARLGGDDAAIADGRVFVGKRRAEHPQETVNAGDEVGLSSTLRDGPRAPILSEYRGLIAASKPAGLPTEPDRSGGASVLRLVAEELGVDMSELHAATRLDVPVSGVVVIARDADARREAAALQDAHALRRRYLAIASKAVTPSSGLWDVPVGDGPRGRPIARGKNAREAKTRYSQIASAGNAALLVLEPLTGRSHQLRVHAETAGAPLLGDTSRGGPRRITRPDGSVVAVERVALHAALVEVTRAGNALWSAAAEIPGDLVSLWVNLGGAASDWDRAARRPWLDAG